LRGAQTPGELKQRSERLHRFADLPAVEGALERLAGRELVAQLPRRPGQKEERYVQLLGGGEQDGALPAAAVAPAPAATPASAAAPTPDSAAPALEERLGRLEHDVAALREQLSALRAQLGA